MHEDSNDSGLVIHKNIKPRNIMIDESFNAKLGDFGLANFTNHALVPELVPPALRTGYMERESYGRPSVQADMFGFGVVLLVMGSGRHHVEFAKEDDGSLTVVDKPHIRDLVLMDYKRGGVQAAADPRLKDFVSDEMKTMLRVGLLCVSTDLEKRPAARDVLKWLESPKSWKNMPDPMNGGSVSGFPLTTGALILIHIPLSLG
jgi:serine/threonine protein kinase